MKKKKKITALVVALLLVGVSFTPAFAGGRRHHDRGNYNHGHGHHQRHGVSPGLLFGLGALGLFGTYYGFRYIEPRVCEYVPAGPPVWNPTWQRWEYNWVLYCR